MYNSTYTTTGQTWVNFNGTVIQLQRIVVFGENSNGKMQVYVDGMEQPVIVNMKFDAFFKSFKENIEK